MRSKEDIGEVDIAIFAGVDSSVEAEYRNFINREVESE